MEMQVKCGVCNKVLAVVEKTVITSEDQALYQQICSCDQDGQTSIQLSISGE
jgi:hypothetical protein